MKKQSFPTIKLAFLALIVVMTAASAVAQDSPKRSLSQPCSSNDCVGYITSLYVTSAGGTTTQAQVYISLSSGGPSGCSLVSNVYYSLPPGTKGYDQLYGLLLDATAYGEKVDIRVNNGPGPCTVDYVVLY
jgi:hypothetical protein